MTSFNHKIYMLNFYANPAVFQNTFRNIENFLKYDNNILGYWNHIPLVYCFKSRLHSAALREKMAPILGSNFIIVEIRPDNIDGILPQQAWDWFYAPPEERSRLGSLFADPPRGTIAAPPALGQMGKLGDLLGRRAEDKE